MSLILMMKSELEQRWITWVEKPIFNTNCGCNCKNNQHTHYALYAHNMYRTPGKARNGRLERAEINPIHFKRE